jgi:hypothetical protein
VKPYDTYVAELCARLNRHRAKYVIVGATAMQLWGTTRATRDVDVLIEATVPNARRVLAALAAAGFGFVKEWLAEEIATRSSCRARATARSERLPSWGLSLSGPEGAVSGNGGNGMAGLVVGTPHAGGWSGAAHA